MRLGIGVSLICILGGIAVAAGSPEGLSGSDAVSLVRIVNEAEVEASFKKDAFSSLEQLNASSKFKNSLAKQLPGIVIVTTDAVTGSAGGYEISVMPSADGKHYRLAVVPQPTSRCETAVFSGDTGVIYTGKAAACTGK